MIQDDSEERTMVGRLKNFWEKGKFVVGRKLGRGNYGIHNVNFSIIFVAIWMQ